MNEIQLIETLHYLTHKIEVYFQENEGYWCFITLNPHEYYVDKSFNIMEDAINSAQTKVYELKRKFSYEERI